MKIVLTQGLPASGKTTWAMQQVAKGKFANINRDDLRWSLFGKPYKFSKQKEKLVTEAQFSIATSFVSAGINFIVSDTNLNPATITKWKTFAKENNCHFEIKDFTDVSVEECIKRDLIREHSVGEKVIRDMYNRYIKTTPLQYIPNKSLPEAILVDIDGTLAHMSNRSPFEWNLVESDVIDPIIHDLVVKMSANYKIVLLSGRDEICRKETENWLRDNQVPYDNLFMRPQDNCEKDSHIKNELFFKHVAQNYYVKFVLDDRNQVVDMWRDIGLKCLQVAPGDF